MINILLLLATFSAMATHNQDIYENGLWEGKHYADLTDVQKLLREQRLGDIVDAECCSCVKGEWLLGKRNESVEKTKKVRW